MKTANVSKVVPLLVAALLAGCWDESGGDASEARGGVFESPAQWSDWSEPVNLGLPVNSDFADVPGHVSKDGLSFYIFSGSARGGGVGNLDLWVSRRDSVDDAWGTPQNLGTTVNSTLRDVNPTLSADEHRLYFASDRSGNFDLYVSYRQDKKDDFGWGTPELLGSPVNSAASEDTTLTMFEDEEGGDIVVYFSSNRRNPTLAGGGDFDIYETRLLPDGTFGDVVLVEELSVEGHRDRMPAVRKDGLELFQQTTRPGGLGGADLWVSTRASVSDPWAPPVHLGAPINSPTRAEGEQSNDGGPTLSRDGTTLYWASAFRTGNATQQFDIWVSTRTKLKN